MKFEKEGEFKYHCKTAKKGREALEVVWDDGPLVGLDSRKQFDEYAELAKNRGVTAAKDDAGARAAFLDVYKVLMHPRCMNCHPSGDVPLQGDDSHLHAQNVKRGEDGKGKYALKCANCHQDTNLPGANPPPGNPNWHLPKKDMPLVFQGKGPRELADQLKDPKRNGGRTLEQLVEHVMNDKLVLWGWEPGDGRTKPPLSHDEFARKFREWVEKGAASPE